MTRKIIQICECAITSGNMGDQFNISALCDDGTAMVFKRNKKKGWFKYPNIPQDNPAYFEYLTTSIYKLFKKDRAEGLDNDEKEELEELLDDLERYNVSRK